MMNSLLRLDIDNNHIGDLKYWEASNSTLEILNLGYNGLNNIPENIRGFTGLRKLILSGNQFSSTPKWLNELVNLQSIDLSVNNLNIFPELTTLSKLEGINLCSNKITKIPIWIKDFTNLKKLGLNKNKLTSLPVEFSKREKINKIK